MRINRFTGPVLFLLVLMELVSSACGSSTTTVPDWNCQEFCDDVLVGNVEVSTTSNQDATSACLAQFTCGAGTSGNKSCMCKTIPPAMGAGGVRYGRS
jgi:hypothetical protein